MEKFALTLLAMSALAWLAMPVPRGVAAEPIDFRAEGSFGQLPAGWALGSCSAVAINSRNEVFLFHRGPHPIIVCDGEGKFLRAFGDGVIGSAHGLRIDRHDNVWVTDIGNHQVHKFDPHGKLLLTLGNGQAGDAQDQFNKPTDIAFGPQDEVYVTDGYGNGRVMKFSPHGGFIRSWGKLGDGPSEFRIPHAIVVDQRGRLIVGDRENDRIQIFDGDGQLLDTWRGFAPFGIALDRDGNLYVADGRAHQVLLLDNSGRILQRFGKQGSLPGEFNLPHMLAVTAGGELLVAEINGRRFQKLVRK